MNRSHNRHVAVEIRPKEYIINYFGVFLFTNLIMSKLLASNTPHINNITSNGYALSLFCFAEYSFDEDKFRNLPGDQQPSKENSRAFGVPWGLNYLPAIIYGQSKIAMLHSLVN